MRVLATIVLVAVCGCMERSPFQYPVDVLNDENNLGVQALAVDDTHVYFTTGELELARVGKDGAAKSSLASLSLKGPRVAVDDTHVYWLEHDEATSDQGGVWRCDKRACSPEQLFATESACSFTVTGTEVFWMQRGDFHNAPNPTWGIHRYDVSTATASQILDKADIDAYNTSSGDSVDDSSCNGLLPFPEDDRVFFFTTNLCAATISGGSVSCVMQSNGGGNGDLPMAWHDQHVYWAQPSAGGIGAGPGQLPAEIMRVDASLTLSSSTTTIRIAEGNGISDIVVTSDAVYWIGGPTDGSDTTRQLRRIDRARIGDFDSEEVVLHTENTTTLTHMVADDEHIYAGIDNRIIRLELR